MKCLFATVVALVLVYFDQEGKLAAVSARTEKDNNEVQVMLGHHHRSNVHGGEYKEEAFSSHRNHGNRRDVQERRHDGTFVLIRHDYGGRDDRRKPKYYYRYGSSDTKTSKSSKRYKSSTSKGGYYAKGSKGGTKGSKRTRYKPKPTLPMPPYKPAPRPPATKPTLKPTSSPTTSPVEPPTPPPPCVLGLNISCFSRLDDGMRGPPCSDIEREATSCAGQPSTITMLFEFRDCSHSDNGQPLEFPGQIPQCQDQASLPPGSTAFIKAKTMSDGSILFSDSVEVGSTFTMANNVEGLIEIRIQDVETLDSVQTIIFQSSCEEDGGPLSLYDIFGSTQIVGWINSEQNEVNSLAPVIFEFVVSNTGTAVMDPDFSFTFAPPVFLFSSFDNPQEELSGFIAASVPPSVSISIDLYSIDLARTNYTVRGNVSEEGECIPGFDVLEFEVGAQSPTMSPVPGPPTF